MPRTGAVRLPPRRADERGRAGLQVDGVEPWGAGRRQRQQRVPDPTACGAVEPMARMLGAMSKPLTAAKSSVAPFSVTATGAICTPL